METDLLLTTRVLPEKFTLLSFCGSVFRFIMDATLVATE